MATGDRYLANLADRKKENGNEQVHAIGFTDMPLDVPIFNDLVSAFNRDWETGKAYIYPSPKGFPH
jgi:hypothetical protein